MVERRVRIPANLAACVATPQDTQVCAAKRALVPEFYS
jgi:hypothetical protein